MIQDLLVLALSGRQNAQPKKHKLNPLSTNPTKSTNTLKQFAG